MAVLGKLVHKEGVEVVTQGQYVDLRLKYAAALAALECWEESERPLDEIEAEGFKVLTSYGFELRPLGFGANRIENQVLDFVSELRREALKLAEK